MHALELKIPPVALVLLIALAMWCAALLSPSAILPFAVRTFTAAIFGVVGASISLSGVISFRRAKTTVNPTKPNSTSVLVSTGIYRISRNPMYLGFLLVLLGWAAFLSNLLALSGPFAFVFYMNYFQIAPEEKALSARFGAEFFAYKSKVRRWL